MLDRELYLPASGTDDRARCRAAGVPDEVNFATKSQQTQAMLARAFDTGVPFAWVTAEEAYGQAFYVRDWLPQREAAYVLATTGHDRVVAASGDQHRVDELIAALSERSWPRLLVGAGAHGPRTYDWARIPRGHWQPGRGH